jgi:hypothetical protein
VSAHSLNILKEEKKKGEKRSEEEKKGRIEKLKEIHKERKREDSDRYTPWIQVCR